MLVPQTARRGTGDGHGTSGIGFAELRRTLASGVSLDDAHRQRLLELAQRLTRVQALGDEYAGISLSPMAAGVVDQVTATV